MTLLVNVKPQFQPSSASDVRAVVLANRNTPVMTVRWCVGCGVGSEMENGGSGAMVWKGRRTGGDRERAFAPEVGHLDHPSREESAGDANDAQDDLLQFGHTGQSRVRRFEAQGEGTDVTVGDIDRTVAEVCSAGSEAAAGRSECEQEGDGRDNGVAYK